jgi:hypothetical protein
MAVRENAQCQPLGIGSKRWIGSPDNVALAQEQATQPRLEHGQADPSLVIACSDGSGQGV